MPQDRDEAALERHYAAFPEGPRLGRSRVRRLEFETTLQVLDAYLPSRGRILELGSGHGAYSLRYARRGFEVLATDLLEPHVQAIAARARAEGLDGLTCRRLRATDLSELPDEAFDAVLCLGPYYHLRNVAARRRCLDECRRVAKPTATVAVSSINIRMAAAYLAAGGRPVSSEQYAALRDGEGRTDYADDFFNVTHFSSPEQVEGEARSAGLEVVAHAGVDGVFGFFPDLVEGLDEVSYARFAAFHRATCLEPSAPAASGHDLLIARRVS